MVTLHKGKHYIINNDHIATAEEAAKLSAEEGNAGIWAFFLSSSDR